MKNGPKAEPSGTVARMEEWTKGGTFGNGGADGGMDRRQNLRGRWQEWRRDYELEMDWE